MEKYICLARSHFRKNRGTSVGLFLLIALASMLIGLALLLFWDAYPTARREAERLEAGDGYIWIDNDLTGIDEDYFEELFQGEVTRYDARHCLGYSAVSVPFGDGNIAPGVLINDDRAFHKKMDRTEIVVEDTAIMSDYIYLPYQFYTSGGYETGDEYSFELLGTKYHFTVRGFTNTTSFGCNNTGVFEFVVDEDSFHTMWEKDREYAETIIISFDLRDGVKAPGFKIRICNDLLAHNPNTNVYVSLLDETLEGKSFLSLILAVTFLTITLIVLLVILLMLVSSISNYIRENMKTIGVLKAMGYTGKNIRFSLYMMFMILGLGGSVLGVVLSYCLMPIMAKIVVGQMGIPYEVSFHALASVSSVLFVLAFVLCITGLATGKLHRIDPIIALREGMEPHNFRKNRVRLERFPWSVDLGLAVKTCIVNWKQNLITFFVTGLLIYICVLGLLMYENFNRNPSVGLFTFETCGGVVGLDYEAKEEALNYLEAREDISNIRRMINLNFTYNDEDKLLVYIFDDVSRMNNQDVCYKGRLPQYDNEIAISGRFAGLYGLAIGDEIPLDYGANSYRYLITGLVQTCNNAGKEAVMSEAGAEHLIDFTYFPAYFWFDCENKESTQKVLDEASTEYGSHVVTIMNFYETMEGNLTTFKGISLTMLVLCLGIAAVVIVLIMYLLIRALIFNKRKDYGIYKSLGYTSGRLVMQTAVSFMPSIVIATSIFSVIAYYTANLYMNVIMHHFGLMKCTFHIPASGVAAIGAGFVLIAFVFALLQSRKVSRIQAYAMLVEA